MDTTNTQTTIADQISALISLGEQVAGNLLDEGQFAHADWLVEKYPAVYADGDIYGEGDCEFPGMPVQADPEELRAAAEAIGRGDEFEQKFGDQIDEVDEYTYIAVMK